MRSLSAICQVDVLGRIVIPVGIRRKLNIDYRDQVEVYVEGNHAVIDKHVGACMICSKTDGLVTLRENMPICVGCIKKLTEKAAAIAKEIDEPHST